MRAVWLQDQILSYRDDVPQPEPLAGEALVRIRLAGICGTDLELVKGYYPFSGIPGHEFVGDIFQAPDECSYTVRIQLLYRRAYYQLMQQKGWTDPDILMEEAIIEVNP